MLLPPYSAPLASNPSSKKPHDNKMTHLGNVRRGCPGRSSSADDLISSMCSQDTEVLVGRGHDMGPRIGGVVSCGGNSDEKGHEVSVATKEYHSLRIVHEGSCYTYFQRNRHS